MKFKCLLSIIILSNIFITASASAIKTCFGTEGTPSNCGTVYYVDSKNGSDFNSGKSKTRAWKTLGKVNSFTFSPGDKILFVAGGIWNGQLAPKGSGTKNAPIIIDMYGEGNKPAINAYFDERANVGTKDNYYILSLKDQSWWEINNLELNGNNDKYCTRGVCIFAENGTTKHVYLKNCFVRNVDGGNDKLHGGIFYLTTGKEVVSSFDDILIEKNLVMNVNRTAITTDTYNSLGEPLTNVIIRGNFVDTVGGDGIVAKASKGTLVEYNIAKDCNKVGRYSNVAIWAYNAEDTVFQYNEAYLTRSMHDGQGFDSDYMCRRTTFQYNYSHDNEGGAFLICCLGSEDGSTFNEDVVIRYNISQNDRARIFQIGGPSKNVEIYNNTFYIKGGEAVMPVYSNTWGPGVAQNVVFTNNIFYNNGIGEYVLVDGYDITFNNNLYFGNHPKTEPYDPAKITDDPMLAAPGTGGLGIDTLDGYKLLEGSPAIGAGIVIKNNGGKDYWGNEVSETGKPNIGAYEGSGVKQ